MLRASVLSLSSTQSALPAWLRCLAELRALHRAVGVQQQQQQQLQQQRGTGRAQSASCQCGPQHSFEASFSSHTPCHGGLPQQQWRGLCVKSSPPDHPQQQQQQQQQQEQWLDAAADDHTTELQAHFQRHRPRARQQARQQALSYEQQMQQLRLQHEAHLAALAAAQEQQQQQQQQPSPGQAAAAAAGLAAARGVQRVDHPSTKQQQQSSAFGQLGVDRQLLGGLAAMGIQRPTPVQVDAFEPILAGRNCSVQSPTGTGKTLSYLLPLLTRLLPEWRPHKPALPQVVVLCPTQELCMQVLHAARALAPHTPGYAHPIVGGSGLARTLAGLRKRKPLLVTATPGRLGQMMQGGRAQVLAKPGGGNTAAAAVLVLEEADRLCAMDDLKALLPHLSRLPRQQLHSPADHMRNVLSIYQVILVSASLRATSLQTAQAWLDSHPVNLFSDAPADTTPAARAAAAAAAAAAADGGGDGDVKQGQSHWARMLPDTITHQVLGYANSEATYSHDYRRHRPLKRLLQVYVARGAKVLLFTPPTVEPPALATQLETLMGSSYKVSSLYGGQKGQARAAVLAAYNRGELHALVTSDAFGLGLDYKDVDVVVCLDDPGPTTQAYVARAGRTGRMGRPGTVLTLTPRQCLFRVKSQIRRVTKKLQEVQVGGTAPGDYVLEAVQQEAGEVDPEAPDTLRPHTQRPKVAKHVRDMVKRLRRTAGDRAVAGSRLGSD